MMNLHRLTTHNLPPIRLHDHQASLDPVANSSDHHSSTSSQRSMPRDIPIPKHSPTSSRCGSMYGSAASQVPPPILSLEPPSLPPVNHYPSRFDDTPRSERGIDAPRPRRTVLVDVRSRDIDSPSWAPSPINSAPVNDGFSMRSEDSYDRNWRENFFAKEERVSPQESVAQSHIRAPSARCSIGHGDLQLHRLQSAQSIREQMQKSVNAYDSSLVRKLDASTSDPSTSMRNRLTPPRDFRPLTAGSDNGLPLPHHWQMRKDSPSSLPPVLSSSPSSLTTPLERWAHGSDSRPGSSRDQHFPPRLPSMAEYRSSLDATSISSSHPDSKDELGENELRRSQSSSLLGRGYEEPPSRQSRGSCDSGIDEDSQMDDIPSANVHKMKLLTINTPPMSNSYPQNYQRVGSKRRASSPPDEDTTTGTSEPTRKGILLESVGNDMYNSSRRTPPVSYHPLRTSPSGHLKYHPPLPRSGSGSFASTSASSATTMWSSMTPLSAASSVTTMDRASPVASFSPLSDMDVAKESLFRHAPLSRQDTKHRPLPNGATPGKNGSSSPLKLNPAPKYTGIFICECCPKKPKKFSNPADLQLHELEKQYSCAYCPNRFKNKNEAERHQNSLHLRKHSWSCAALAGNYESVFHPSTHRPAHAEVCGYCGKEFPLPAQWGARIEHLTTEHKFGECNQSKKFFRADHFRQHLKHSHNGTSGKWTNILENSCMSQEPADPTPINRGGYIGGRTVAEEVSE